MNGRQRASRSSSWHRARLLARPDHACAVRSSTVDNTAAACGAVARQRFARAQSELRFAGWSPGCVRVVAVPAANPRSFTPDSMAPSPVDDVADHRAGLGPQPPPGVLRAWFSAPPLPGVQASNVRRSTVRTREAGAHAFAPARRTAAARAANGSAVRRRRQRTLSVAWHRRGFRERCRSSLS